MTITSQTTKVVALGDGIATVFNYSFLIPDAASVQVIYEDVTGALTTLLPAQYTITGLGLDAGGTVTYPLSGSPIAVGTSLTIARNAAIVQLTSLDNQGGFYPQSVEDALDYLTILLQQIDELFTRALVVPITEPSAPLTIPTIALRKNQFLGFDGSGLPIAGLPVSSALISAAMQPVTAAATLALARTALGLGTMATETIGAGLQDNGAGAVRVNYTPVSVSGAQAVDSTYHLKRYQATGSITFTLPKASTLWNGFGFWVDSYVGTITFAINAADQFKGSTAAGVSFTLPPGYKAFVFTDGAASGIWYVAAFQTVLSGNTVSANVGQGLPGGRLTLTTATPVLSADTTAQGTVFYTPYLSGRLPLYDGVSWVTRDFVEMSQTLADTTKSPAAGAANSVYDLFVWDDVGTLRCTRGPLWTSATARGAGAGTTELVYQNGILLNANAITNGPGAKRGLYVGTVATDGSVQCNMMFAPAAAAGGTNNRLDVWNMYNRVNVNSISRDSTDTWTYVTATMRSANNNANNRITAVFGLNEDGVRAQYHAFLINNNGGVGTIGVGLDSTSAMSGVPATMARTATADPVAFDAVYSGLAGQGRHFFQALEQGAAAIGAWCGDNAAPTIVQMGLFLQGRM